jgi:hypothetical protein
VFERADDDFAAARAVGRQKTLDELVALAVAQ